MYGLKTNMSYKMLKTGSDFQLRPKQLGLIPAQSDEDELEPQQIQSASRLSK
jgi:hypothetical protein